MGFLLERLSDLASDGQKTIIELKKKEASVLAAMKRTEATQSMVLQQYYSSPATKTSELDPSILTEDQAFRNYMDQNNRERKIARIAAKAQGKRYANATPSIISTSPSETLKEFDGWKHVPKNLKTKKQWLRASRKVANNAVPVARVVYPVVVEGRGFYNPATIILAQWNDGAIMSSDPSPLHRR